MQTLLRPGVKRQLRTQQRTEAGFVEPARRAYQAVDMATVGTASVLRPFLVRPMRITRSITAQIDARASIIFCSPTNPLFATAFSIVSLHRKDGPELIPLDFHRSPLSFRRLPGSTAHGPLTASIQTCRGIPLPQSIRYTTRKGQYVRNIQLSFARGAASKPTARSLLSRILWLAVSQFLTNQQSHHYGMKL
ncbi:hypothetical protein LZ32DRAFT_414320 [Colletotrichum eremochloae]|nr:hypothetical protein LZ32DRAFT_414320 [Colletotrichum eremochloae]